MDRRIEEIITDPGKSLDEKINLVIALRPQYEEASDAERLAFDVDCFSSLIDLVSEDNETHLHDLELLQLYVLLAETYVAQEDYRALGEVARGVLDVIRYDVTTWEAMEETMPRIIDAVGESVYNHSLYELLLLYLRAAYHAGRLNVSLAGRVRRFLKLRILLDDSEWLDRLLDKDFQKALASLLSQDELMHIIMRPQIGHLRKDPVEYTWEWERIYYDVEARLDERFANAPRQMGFCFLFWNAKRELLEEEYGIKWRSPSQMNPGVMFD